LSKQAHQSSNDIFINQTKYVDDMLARFAMDCKLVAPPTVVNRKLMKENSSLLVDAMLYMSLVGSLMYLTATRLDIMFAVSLVA